MGHRFWLAFGVAACGSLCLSVPLNLGLKSRAYRLLAAVSPNVTHEGYALVSREWRERAPVQGYFDRHSVRPGETIRLMLSRSDPHASVRGKIRIDRVSGGSIGGRTLMHEQSDIEVPYHRVRLGAASAGAAWPPTLRIHVDPSWTSGVYLASFVAGAGEPIHVGLFVVTNPQRDGEVLVKLPTNTYAAYNDWGGHSLYRSHVGAGPGRMVSFDRPERGLYFEWDDDYVRWLEDWAAQNGIKLDYATNFDVHQAGTWLDAYKLLVCVGHDEYWSKEEFDHIYRRIFQRGGNTLFLGANIAYWQVRYADVHRAPEQADRGRQLVCFKRDHDPIVDDEVADGPLLRTTLFRHEGRRPESMLMGVAWEGAALGEDLDAVALRVADANLPFFAGTGLKPGDSVGALVGYEWDRRDPTQDGQRLWNSKSTIPPIPADSLTVVFEAFPRGVTEDAQGAHVPLSNARAESVYFETAAGAKVFSAGAMRWAWGLSKPSYQSEAFRKLNANLHRYFLEPGHKPPPAPDLLVVEEPAAPPLERED